MRLLSKLLSLTLIYNICRLFKSLNRFINDYAVVGDAIHSEDFLYILRQYLHTDFEIDWIGRVYGIINPSIDINGKRDFNNSIIELDDERTSSRIYVESWVYKQMSLIDQIFRLRDYYEYISVDFKHVGPLYDDNFLIVFDVVGRNETWDLFKRVFYQILVYSIIVMIIFAIV